MTPALTGRLLPVVALATALTGLTACGGSSTKAASPAASSAAPTAAPTPTKPAVSDVLNGEGTTVLAAVKANFVKSGSVHLTAKDGKNGVDLKASDKGTTGYLTVDGIRIDIVAIGSAVYYKAPRALYKQQGAPAQAIELLGGRWVKGAKTTKGFEEFATFTSLKDLADELFDPSGPVKKGETVTREGQQLVELIDSGADGGTFFLTTADPVLPVLLVDEGSKESTATHFTEYGMPVTLTPPPNPVDLAKLKG
jgi:hypothetical protein